MLARRAGIPHWCVTTHTIGNRLGVFRFALRTLHGRTCAPATGRPVKEDIVAVSGRRWILQSLKKWRGKPTATSYQTAVTSASSGKGEWWTRRDSNPRPQRCERRALPTELRAHVFYNPWEYNTTDEAPTSFMEAGSRQIPRRLPTGFPAGLRPGRNPGFRRPCPQTEPRSVSSLQTCSPSLPASGKRKDQWACP